MGFGTRAGPLPKLGHPKAFSGTEGPKHHRPTAHYHGTALSRPRWLWSLLRLARGPSAGSSRSAGSLRLARGPLYRAPRRASAQGDLRLARDHPQRVGTAAQPPDGTGRIYSSTTPRHRAGVRRRQLALAITPHSGRDRRPLSLHRPLYRYSRRRAGLRSSVRTCLTPPTTVPPTPCAFLSCKTVSGQGRRPSNNNTALDQGKAGAFGTLERHLIRRRVLCPQQSPTRRLLGLQHADTPWARREDGAHARRHALRRSATRKTNCSPPDRGEKGRPIDILHV